MGSQSELIEGLRKGEAGAFEELIRLYGGRLFLKANQMLGNVEDAKDCVQECYVQVHRNIDQFRGDADLYSWMYRILVNGCLKKMKARSTAEHQPLDDLMPIFDTDGCRIEPLWQKIPTAEEILDEKVTRERVLEAIQGLPPAYRDVLYLRDIEGYSTAEVSEMLTLSLSATKVRLHRARSALKKILEPVFLERRNL